MANQELIKKADRAAKAYARWHKQMRIDGFTKREELSADTADPTNMTALSRALWEEYVSARADADLEAESPSQPELDIVEGSGSKRGRKS